MLSGDICLSPEDGVANLTAFLHKFVKISFLESYFVEKIVDFLSEVTKKIKSIETQYKFV